MTPAGAGVTYPWPLGNWTEGLAGRRVLSSTHALLTGERVATNGLAFVADAYSAPDVPMDPAVGVDNGAWKQLLYLDDGLIRVGCGSDAGSRQVALSEMSLQRHVTTSTSTAWVDSRTYVLDGLRVVKEVRLPAQGDQVMVTLSADCGTGFAASLLAPLQPALPTVPVSMDGLQAIFGFRGWKSFTSEWSASSQVAVEGSAGAETILAVAPAGQQPWHPAGEIVAAALVESPSPQAELSLAFTVKGWPSGDGAGLRTFTAQEAIDDHDVTFAVVDRQPSQPWFGDPLAVPVGAWLDGGPYFQRLSDDGRVAAYRVVAPLAGDDRAASTTNSR
jgi:hypothetical protein